MRPETRNALGHIGFGLILTVVFASLALAVTGHPAQSVVIGWAMQSAYWLGRERRDQEIHVGKADFEDIAHKGWYRGWNVLAWTADGRRDLFAPVIVNAAVAATVVYGTSNF